MYILFEVMGDLPLHVLFWAWHPESFSGVSYVALLQILLDGLPVDPLVDHQDPRAASILDPRASIQNRMRRQKERKTLTSILKSRR